MAYRKYLLSIAAAALIGWISFSLVIFRLEPCLEPGEKTLCHSASTLGLLLFFLSVFFALTATFTFLSFSLRLWLHPHEIYLDHLSICLRQGMLLTFCSIGALGLLLLNALTWWSGLLLIGIIILLELYFTRS